MVSQDDRLLPISQVERTVDRPLASPLSRGYGYGGASTELNLRDYLNVVLKRKWLILTIVLVVTSLVTIQMYRLPSVYEAVATVQIDPRRDSVLKSGKEIVINTGNQRDPQYWATQLKLLENPQLARQVIITLDLTNNPDFLGNQGQAGIFMSLRRIIAPPKPAADKAEDESDLTVVSEEQVMGQQLSAEQLAKMEPYEDALRAGLSVEPVAGTSLVNLRFQHTDPVIAQKIVNTTAEVFAFNNLERINTVSKESETLLAQKIAELQLKIKEQEETRLSTALKIGVGAGAVGGSGGASQGGNLSQEQLSEYSKQLLDAENDRKNAEAIYQAAASATDPTAVPEVAGDSRIQKLREKLDELKQKRAELLVVYNPEWPAVKEVDEQINHVTKALEIAPKEIVSALKTKYEAVKSREEKLRASYRQKYGETADQSIQALQLGSLDSELETNKQYLNTLLQRQNDISNTKDNITNNVTVPEQARVPRAPVGPARMRNIVLSFLVALAAGIGLAFLLDYLDDTLKSVDDVDRYIRLPALALIPADRSEKLRLRGHAPGPADGQGTAMALIGDVRSPVAEAYRHLRTSLLLSSAGQPPKTILVTSSQPSEGKTTTAVNTAVMLAQTGAEVVILDCDLRRPRIHAHFQIGNSRGVTNFLSGEAELDASMQEYPRLPNLKVMTSGPVPPNPAELLGSDEMRRLLTLLVERFQHVIIDSPPAISFTDASILSTMVDGVMLVVHGGRSSRAVVRRAKQQLADVGANIFGVVLNNVRLESTDYYYYPGYYGSYYSDDGESSDGAAEAGTGRAG